MANVRSSVNQQVQAAVESTRGTGVPATKLLTAFTWTLGGDPVTKQFRGTGRQYDSASAPLYFQSKGTVAGPGDFAELVYLFSSLWGSGSPTLHAPSTTAFDWTWTPPLTGSYAANAKSLTVQMGDVVDAEQYTFLVLTALGYSINRKQEMTISGDLLSQDFTDGITLTASPTQVAQSPITGAMFNLYLDTTSTGIGATQLTKPVKVDFKASDYYEGYYPINRANTSFTDIKDKAKKNELTVELEADSTAIAIKGNYLATGSRCYVRVDGQGPTIDAPNSVKAAFRHDMACFVSKVDPFADSDGIYAVKYTLQVAEDTGWSTGTAQKISLTNLVATL